MMPPREQRSVPVIDVENVSKRFYLRYTREMVATGLFRSLLNRRRSEAFWALRNVSFSVERGESVAIIGPNGSGKTTLLSIISGVTRPTEGRTATQGRVSALLQLGAGFHPDLTGRENVYINAGVLGFRKREIHAIYPSIAEFSELGSFLDVPVRRYSSGMLGRLGFSIAIHVQPEIIIVDEVLSVGDQQFQEKCRDKILAFLETGVTVLFVSHSAAAVRELCQKAVYLEHGEVQAFGEASEVLAAYAARAKRGPPGGAAVRAEGTAGARPTAPPMAPPAASPAAAPTPPSKAPAAPAATTAPADSPAPSAAPPQPDGKAPSSGVPPNRRVPSGPPDARSTGLPSLTCFYRNGPQVAALFDHVLPLIRSGPVLRIRCWGSATGSDAYTLAMEYDRRHITEYRLAIEAFDCNPERVQAAIGGKYNATEVCGKGSSAMPREFLCACFQEDADGGYILRDRIRSRVLFGVGDYLHAACVDLPAADVVMAQDQLVDPEPAAARQAVACLVAQTRPGGVLCLGGTPPDLLVEAAGAHGLEPLTCQIEAIHAGWISGRNPPETAWGRGPVDRSLPDWQIRHCSFFRKPGGGERGASPGDA